MAIWHKKIEIGGVRFHETKMGCGHMQSKGLHDMIQYEKGFQDFKKTFEENKHLFMDNHPHPCSTILHVDGENYMKHVEGGLPRYLKCMEELGFKLLITYNNPAHPPKDTQYLFALIIE